MDDPTALVPAPIPTLDTSEPSSTVREQLRKSTDADGAVDRKSLMAQIGGGVAMSSQQRKSLQRLADPEKVSLLPTGEVYMEGKYWRDVLNETFGPMQWGVLSPSEPVLELAPPDTKGVKSMLYLEVFLKVKGRCVAYAIGAQEYFPGSKRMTKDDALEGCRTNGLMRCLKQFGTYGNLWESRWSEPARALVGVKVKCADQWRPFQWRRLDEEPFDNEVTIAPDSPNQEAYAERFPQKMRAQEARGETRRPHREEHKATTAQTAKPAHQPDVIDGQGRAERGVKILVIRQTVATNTSVDPPQQVPMWVVNTDDDQYITVDHDVVKALEIVKANKQKVVITYESLRGAAGHRKRIIEFTVEKH